MEIHMSQDRLVKIERDSVNNGLLRYRVFGLNVFVANTAQGDSRLLALQDKPGLKFLGALAQRYETVCLLGSPAPDNWRNQMQREGRPARIEDLLGKETSRSGVHVSYYGGTFRAEQDYGPSLLFGLRDQELLAKLSHPFLGWDALALLMYVNGKDGLSAAQTALRGFTTETDLIETLLREARYLVLTQADCQYVEVYTKASDAGDELDAAGMEAEAYIKSTEWYQKNKATLVWDETELCYIKRATA